MMHNTRAHAIVMISLGMRDEIISKAEIQGVRIRIETEIAEDLRVTLHGLDQEAN